MSLPETPGLLAGRWKGVNRLNLSQPSDPIGESESTADIVTRINGQCLEIAYTWKFESSPQEGVLIITTAPSGKTVSAVWTDSWHSADTLMVCKGTISDGGNINIKGFYPVPDHPDWGWRMELVPANDTFKYLMFNVSPEGEEEWAVEMEFVRS